MAILEITTQPQSQEVSAGDATSLNVVVTGGNPQVTGCPVGDSFINYAELGEVNNNIPRNINSAALLDNGNNINLTYKVSHSKMDWSGLGWANMFGMFGNIISVQYIANGELSGYIPAFRLNVGGIYLQTIQSSLWKGNPNGFEFDITITVEGVIVGSNLVGSVNAEFIQLSNMSVIDSITLPINNEVLVSEYNYDKNTHYLISGDILLYIQGQGLPNDCTGEDSGYDYQWKKDAVDIIGETSDSLALNNIQLDGFASYTVEVTDGNEIVLSNAAILSEDVDPSIYNSGYIGNLPVGDKPFPDPSGSAWNANNHNLEQYPWDYQEPVGIQAVGSPNNSNELSYKKFGLYELEGSNRLSVPNKNLVNYAEANEYLTSDLIERTYNTSVSVLEKIYKLGNLKDPSLIDFEYISYFADHIGYDMKLNMFHFESNIATIAKFNSTIDQIETDRMAKGIYKPLSLEARENIYNMLVGRPSTDMIADEYDLDREILDEVKTQFIEMQVRALIENLPYWYKIKGTDDSLKILLYSFGLICDIHNYYTANYSTDRQDWEVADVFYNTSRVKTNENKVNASTEDFSEIPDDWYPTPHFQVKFDYNATWATAYKTGVLSNMEKFGSMVEAIHASKPINTVFKGLAGIFRTGNSQRVGVKTLMRIILSSTVYPDVIERKYGIDEDGKDLLVDFAAATEIGESWREPIITFVVDDNTPEDATTDEVGERTHYQLT